MAAAEPHGSHAQLRYASLDHWRGFAALSVMVFHAFGQLRGAGLAVHPSMAWVREASDYGGMGVHLFFVISGYCIAANLHRLSVTTAGAWDFLRDRLLRIYPPYWAACAATIAMNALASPFNQVPVVASLPKDWTGTLANILLLQPYLGNVPPLMLVSWSLVLEVGFYLLAALGFALWRAGASVGMLLVAGFALGLFGLVCADGPLLAVLRLWPEFACGGAVFVALSLKGRKPGLAWLATAVIPIFAAVAVVESRPGDLGAMLLAAGFALLLRALHPWDAVIAGARPLRLMGWIGTISYSLYLTHVHLGLRVIPLGIRWVEHDSAWMWPLQALGWCGSVAVAWVFYRLCEAPCERWRRGLRATGWKSRDANDCSDSRG